MNILVRFSLAGVLAAGSFCSAQDSTESERGVRLHSQPGNVSYDIQLTRGAERAIVQPSYKFETGDRFTLRVRVAKNSYVYVLNRTFVGSPDSLKSSRQVRLVPENSSAPGAGQPDDTAQSSEPMYSMVYPQTGNRLLKAGQMNLIPGSQMALEMDNNPGVEHLVLVVSPRPLDIATLFNTQTGEMKHTAAAGKADRPSDLYPKLRQELAQMAQNSEVQESSRSIEFVDAKPAAPPMDLNPAPAPAKPADTNQAAAAKPPVKRPAATVPASVAAPKQEANPYLVDIVLAHYAPA